MLRCKEVAELVASDAWRNPPVLRRLAVLAHLAMCRHCRAYVRQLRRIGEAARRLFDERSASDFTTRMTTLVREAATSSQSDDSAGPP